jgi:parallel beta-helix repeat protein
VHRHWRRRSCSALRGYECDGCFFETYYNNASYYNTRHGIAVDDDDIQGAGDFYIWDNYVEGNLLNGIRVQDANNGTVQSNEVTGHTCDLNQSGASGNTWSSNMYTTRCGSVPIH